MRQIIICFIIFLVNKTGTTRKSKITSSVTDSFFIDVNNGNDDWSGHFATPSQSNNDGPLRTIKGAVLAIRKYRRRNSVDKITVYLRRGVYRLIEPIILQNKDSGLRFRSYDDEDVIISGANQIAPEQLKVFRKLRTGQPDAITIYRARYNGKCSMHAFYGEQRLIRARKPDLEAWTGENMSGEGPYLHIKDLLKSNPTCDKTAKGRFKQTCPEEDRLGFRFQSGDLQRLKRSIKSSEGVDFLIFHAWTAERGRVKQVFQHNTTVLFDSPLHFAVGTHPKPSGWRYIVENALSELDFPGEYFCDERVKKFFVALPQDYSLTESIRISEATRFFKIRSANDITFNGLKFKYSNSRKISGYNQMPAAIEVFSSHQFNVSNCHFHHMGHTAIYGYQSQFIFIENNSFKDIGYNGIVISYNNDPNDIEATKNVQIKMNTMNGCGVMNLFQPCCIHVKGVRNIEVKRNEIQRSSYSGIRVGWQKAFLANHVREGEYVFRISENHVFNFGMGILNDFGGIYLATNAEDCKIKQNMSVCNLHAFVSKNVVHNGKGFHYGGSGVYGDSAASSIQIESNWLYKLHGAVIIFHCGQRNKAIGNVAYQSSSGRLIGTCNPSLGDETRIPRQDFSILANVFYIANEYARMWRKFDIWKFNSPDFDNNTYFFKPTNKNQKNSYFPKGKSFKQWKMDDNEDSLSLIADPLFKSIENDDFRFKAISPVSRVTTFNLDLRYVRARNFTQE